MSRLAFDDHILRLTLVQSFAYSAAQLALPTSLAQQLVDDQSFICNERKASDLSMISPSILPRNSLSSLCLFHGSQASPLFYLISERTWAAPPHPCLFASLATFAPVIFYFIFDERLAETDELISGLHQLFQVALTKRLLYTFERGQACGLRLSCSSLDMNFLCSSSRF